LPKTLAGRLAPARVEVRHAGLEEYPEVGRGQAPGTLERNSVLIRADEKAAQLGDAEVNVRQHRAVSSGLDELGHRGKQAFTNRRGVLQLVDAVGRVVLGGLMDLPVQHHRQCQRPKRLRFATGAVRFHKFLDGSDAI